MRLKHALKLSSIAIIAIMLFPNVAEEATIYQMYYPPWRFYWDEYSIEGWLSKGYAKAESEQYPSTGYWEFYLKAQSVVWIAHNAIVYGAMGCCEPNYVMEGQTITITIGVHLKGYLFSAEWTGYAQMRIYIWLRSIGGDDEVFYLVDQYEAQDGIYIGLDQTRTYRISHKATNSGEYRVSMYLDAQAYSGSSGGAEIDFKYSGRYIQLQWIEFKATW